MKKFNYFISLRFLKDNKFGFMNITISYNKKIKNTKDIRIIERKIEQIYNYDTITILNYKLF